MVKAVLFLFVKQKKSILGKSLEPLLVLVADREEEAVAVLVIDAVEEVADSRDRVKLLQVVVQGHRLALVEVGVLAIDQLGEYVVREAPVREDVP